MLSQKEINGGPISKDLAAAVYQTKDVCNKVQRSIRNELNDQERRFNDKLLKVATSQEKTQLQVEQIVTELNNQKEIEQAIKIQEQVELRKKLLWDNALTTGGIGGALLLIFTILRHFGIGG